MLKRGSASAELDDAEKLRQTQTTTTMDSSLRTHAEYQLSLVPLMHEIKPWDLSRCGVDDVALMSEATIVCFPTIKCHNLRLPQMKYLRNSPKLIMAIA